MENIALFYLGHICVSCYKSSNMTILPRKILAFATLRYAHVRTFAHRKTVYASATVFSMAHLYVMLQKQ